MPDLFNIGYAMQIEGLKTADISWQGDHAPASLVFDDVYFSKENGWQETEHVFIEGSGLPALWNERDSITIGETGFGTGLNFFVTATLFLKHAKPNAVLHYHSIEAYPVAPEIMRRLYSIWPCLSDVIDAFLPHYHTTEPLCRVSLYQGRIIVYVYLSDIADAVKQMHIEADVWYLDGFSPAKNPQMWRADVLHDIGSLTRKDGCVATFTAARMVREGLAQAGFAITKQKGYGHKRHMLTGVKE